MWLYFNRYRLKQISNKKLEKLVNERDVLIQEKDCLVKEIHHRVKNNLQIVISLMNIQSNYVESDAALFAIKEIQSRMNAISLIHQKLYQSASLVSIDMPKYIAGLVSYLMDSFGTSRVIKTDIKIDDI